VKKFTADLDFVPRLEGSLGFATGVLSQKLCGYLRETSFEITFILIYTIRNRNCKVAIDVNNIVITLSRLKIFEVKIATAEIHFQSNIFVVL